jgi:hypothetical protein
MPDDPNKRGPQDRKRVSKQTHEQAYQKRKRKSQEQSTDRGSNLKNSNQKARSR